MNRYCKGCKHHHVAKAAKEWCCLYGVAARKAEGQCKLKNGKVMEEENGN
jgi:hypothetical protein